MARNYYTCPTCGLNLDHGETCENCREREEEEKDIKKDIKKVVFQPCEERIQQMPYIKDGMQTSFIYSV